MKNKYINLVNRYLLGYFNGELYQVTDKGFVPNKQHIAPKFLVVSRDLYIERYLVLPITNKKEVQTAIQFEIEDLRENFYVSFHIESSNESSTKIKIWQVAKSGVPQDADYIIPETFLLAQVVDINSAVVFNNGLSEKLAIISKRVDDINSSITTNNDLPVFLLSVGLNSNSITHLDEQTYSATISSLFWKNLVVVSSKFSCKDKITLKSIFAKVSPVVVPVAVCFFAYLGITSTYLVMKNQAISDELDSQTDSVDEVLAIQRDNADLIAQFNSIIEFQPQSAPLWKVWEILHPLYEKNVQFQFIRFNGRQVFFKAKAESAANVLDALYQNKDAVDPSFTSSVQKSAGLETFIIKFSLFNPGGNNEG